ncbi:MAG: ATP synthase F1 subunit gamma [Phycisphaerales bacterium]
MAKTREIKKRIKAVANIRRITKTMQMIATSKFARAQQASVASKPYTETLFELVTQLAASLGSDVSHPLLKSKGQGKELTLIITSERGLCGPYNGSVLRSAMAFLRNNPGAKNGVVEIVGKKGMGFLKYAGVQVARQHNQFGDKPTYENVRALAEDYTQRFLAGELSAVRVISMKYMSAGKQSPHVLQLLPFQTENAARKGATSGGSGTVQIYEFSPSAGELLDTLLPAAIKALLFQAFNDAVVSEHVARMVAMKSATDNAGKAGKRYTRIYNRARQAQITTELTEIISGAAALE